MNQFKLYRLTILLIAAGILTTACSTSNGADTPSPNPSVPSSVSPAASGDSSASTRTVQDANGSVEIPANPQRIVDLAGLAEPLLFLGHKPIATTTTYNNELPAELAKQLPDTKPLDYMNYDIEQIAELDPDLILIYTLQADKIESFQKIAPTVVLPVTEKWQDSLTVLGGVLNAEEQMAGWMADFSKSAKQLQEKILAETGDETFALLEMRGKTMIMHDESFGPGALFFNELKLPLPKGASAAEKAAAASQVSRDLNMEGLLAYNPDHVFVSGPETFMEDMKKDPIWTKLKAYQKNQIYFIDEETLQTYGYGEFGWPRMLSLIETQLLGGGAK
ncbi:ABC transporter substrate-binding protein [Paenibacillus pasadenensis]|uniref:ABC transporter substrate-binding protein n=1 Tax=Paenibacillus pasadenensis TaxID=217090 RepID=UPI00203CA6E8|nr:ABC transporter substrate-binding protein [Paenibacillus pasadenensis]MCM3749637.1 ABC transporter substrate-binding protein [Paenibacillus pasadenensis]